MDVLAVRGVDLTVVEMGDRMVPRMMTTPKAGNMIRQWVEATGRACITNAGIDRIDAVNGADDAVAAAKPSGLGASMRALRDRFITGAPTAAESNAPAAADGAAPLRIHLTTGAVLEADLVIVSAGVAPNVGFLEATPVHVAKGVFVNDRLETTVPGIFAAGDVAEAPDLFTGAHLVSAIQPNAVDQARVAALNMAGKDVRLPGVLAINVLDTLRPGVVVVRSVVGRRMRRTAWSWSTTRIIAI